MCNKIENDNRFRLCATEQVSCFLVHCKMEFMIALRQNIKINIIKREENDCLFPF